MDSAVIRRTDYPAMRGNQLSQNQPHKWYRQALTDYGCQAKQEEEEGCDFTFQNVLQCYSTTFFRYSSHLFAFLRKIWKRQIKTVTI